MELPSIKAIHIYRILSHKGFSMCVQKKLREKSRSFFYLLFFVCYLWKFRQYSSLYMFVSWDNAQGISNRYYIHVC